MKTFRILGLAMVAWTSVHGACAQSSHRSSAGSRDMAPAIYAPSEAAPGPTTQPQAVQPQTGTPTTSQDASPQVPSTQYQAQESPTPIDVPFDFNAFCSAPSADGKARSPVWIQSCMAGATPPAGQQQQNSVQPH